MAEPSLDALRLLVAVADLGSISAAARAAGIAQPSASARVREAERRLGLTLVERRSHGAVLTADGRAVVTWARAVVEAADALVTGAQALRTSRPTSVAASQTVAEFLVPVWLAALREAGASVRLRVANSSAVVAAVRDRSADLGFVEGPTAPEGPDLTGRTLRSDRLVLVVAPGHPMARGRGALGPADVAGLDLVWREEGSGTRETLVAALARAGVEAPDGVTVDSNAAVKVLLAAGGHAAALSELAVATELRDGRLVAPAVEGLDLRRRLRAVWRADSPPRDAALELLRIATR